MSTGRFSVLGLATAAALLAACTSGATSVAPPASTPHEGLTSATAHTTTTPPSSAASMLTGSDVSTPPAARPSTDRAARRAKVVTNHLDVPWGLAFLPGGDILVGERDRAKILLVRPDGSRRLATSVRGVVPNGQQGGEAGLLGITLSPHFATDHWVYVYLSSRIDNRVIRMKWQHRSLQSRQLVIKAIPRSLHHNGGRIAFGPDGMLYVTTGDAEVPAHAQNRHALGGKILRMTPRGAPAPGNPFAHSVVYSYGHRNVEGLGWDSRGRLWATEFGDHAYDELNLIRPGRNYGWPHVEGMSNDRRFVNPKLVWRTDNAGPSGIAITRLHGRTLAYIGALTGTRLWRVVLAGATASNRKALYVDTLGRIRTTAVARGALWFTTSNTDGRATPHARDDKLIRVPLS